MRLFCLSGLNRTQTVHFCVRVNLLVHLFLHSIKDSIAEISLDYKMHIHVHARLRHCFHHASVKPATLPYSPLNSRLMQKTLMTYCLGVTGRVCCSCLINRSICMPSSSTLCMFGSSLASPWNEDSLPRMPIIVSISSITVDVSGFRTLIACFTWEKLQTQVIFSHNVLHVIWISLVLECSLIYYYVF